MDNADLDLGNGFTGRWISDNNEDDKHIGLLLVHECGAQPLLWDAQDVYAPLFTLQWEEPLSILPHVNCPQCGQRGWVRVGRWVPYDERPPVEVIQALGKEMSFQLRSFVTAAADHWDLAAEGALLKFQDRGFQIVERT